MSPKPGMYLTRLRVEQLRQFRQPFELRDLEPGLNLFTGPNEAGKSTLVRAIRAAFFERHRSTAVDDLRPWGDTGAAPAIELDFMLDGRACRLSKSFLGRKRCSLHLAPRAGEPTAGQQLEGVEAEDRLAQLFGFQFAGKGASKSEHWGIPGLLWVEQGTGQELHDAARHARDHLHDALQGLIGGNAAGELAATGGDEVLEQLRAWRAELLTPQGRPRGAHSEALEQVQVLESGLAALDTRIATYRQQVDQLASERALHQADEVQRPWDRLRGELEAARQREAALKATQRQLDDDRIRHAQREQTRGLLLEQIEAHQQQAQERGRREAALAEAGTRLQASAAALAPARQQAEATRAASVRAREQVQAARQDEHRRTLLEQQARDHDGAARLQDMLDRARAGQQALVQLRQAAAASAITLAEVQALRQLDARRRHLALQREAVATRLTHVLQPGQRVRLDGLALEGRGERHLSAPAVLVIEGVGEFTIIPGGQDLATLARDEAAAQDGLLAALQRAGLQDLDEAEARLLTHEDLRTRIQLAEQALALSAPRGVEALAEEADRLAARRLTTATALARLAPAAEQAGSHTELGAPDLARAEALQDSTRQDEDRAAAALSLAQQQHAASLSREAEARRELDAVRCALDDPQRLERHAEAQRQLLEASAERDALATRMASTQAQIEAIRPDLVQQDLLRLSRSIEQAEQAHQRRREQILLLEHDLHKAGAQGLEEQREHAAGELGRARRRLDELQRRAAALDLLCRQLDARRQATITRLQAPLQRHLDACLRLLMPQARLQIDAQLAPGALTRPDHGGVAQTGEFGALSFGAREQLGLISRFAYADLLREAGRPTLLILDDALVHSDAGRLAQMKRVLFDAAQRHQVLLFSCHPEAWRDLGAIERPIVRPA
ncbi:DNA repair exonuclease SbcCD ATPase subunit [Sphaerotilus hippei]|uniref:DNA repair exonuclease SbcCD ATPase subunit n=1 Tax=Sphaerotilus hippei TaxID=744406 RepID=A0A318GX98_9BURK|nr:AAA family ATPase [Sphaerotilus hippei]PXW92415.1 DNA repair exonuclease SbcCD ATPase subunit [Sphaerotilus hippei]